MAVVQFGFAIIGASFTKSPFILGITSGIVSSYRNADELSITTTHLLTAIGANFLELSPPAEKIA